jgi:hypothetical protein
MLQLACHIVIAVTSVLELTEIITNGSAALKPKKLRTDIITL